MTLSTVTSRKLEPTDGNFHRLTNGRPARRTAIARAVNKGLPSHWLPRPRAWRAAAAAAVVVVCVIVVVVTTAALLASAHLQAVFDGHFGHGLVDRMSS